MKHKIDWEFGMQKLITLGLVNAAEAVKTFADKKKGTKRGWDGHLRRVDPQAWSLLFEVN
jgi:hypothetical protein